MDTNAPLPGTYDPAVPDSGVFPLGHPGPLFAMESSGIFRQNQLVMNVNSKVSRTVSLFGTYVYNLPFSTGLQLAPNKAATTVIAPGALAR